MSQNNPNISNLPSFAVCHVATGNTYYVHAQNCYGAVVHIQAAALRGEIEERGDFVVHEDSIVKQAGADDDVRHVMGNLKMSFGLQDDVDDDGVTVKVVNRHLYQ
jgi:hypothetical protein